MGILFSVCKCSICAREWTIEESYNPREQSPTARTYSVICYDCSREIVRKAGLSDYVFATVYMEYYNKSYVEQETVYEILDLLHEISLITVVTKTKLGNIKAYCVFHKSHKERIDRFKVFVNDAKRYIIKRRWVKYGELETNRIEVKVTIYDRHDEIMSFLKNAIDMIENKTEDVIEWNPSKPWVSRIFRRSGAELINYAYKNFKNMLNDLKKARDEIIKDQK